MPVEGRIKHGRPILDLLRSNGPFTAAQISRRLGVGKFEVASALGRLRSIGRVERVVSRNKGKPNLWVDGGNPLTRRLEAMDTLIEMYETVDPAVCAFLKHEREHYWGNGR